MKIPFKWYMHADKADTFDFFKNLGRQNQLGLDTDALEELKWSFYEVELACELDTETLEVTILSAK